MLRRTSSAAVHKRATYVSIRSDLLAAVKRKKWREENRDAIQAYNEHVEKHGTLSDDVRGF
jgi:antitoxin CcdA